MSFFVVVCPSSVQYINMYMLNIRTNLSYSQDIEEKAFINLSVF